MASDPLFVNNTAVLPGRDLAIGVDVSPAGYGPYTDGNVGYFNGLIDELRIYNRALSSDEIFQLYQGTSGLTISTKTLSSVQKDTFSSQQMEARLGTAPFSWSIVAGSLPQGMTLSSGGILSGTPTAAGSFPLTIRVTDSQNQPAQNDFILNVLLIAPPPLVRISKTGTVAVPGRTSDYFIQLENLGETDATNLEVLEAIDPLTFALPSAQAPNGTTLSAYENNFVLDWKLPLLRPLSSQVLSYTVATQASVSEGAPVVGPACERPDRNKLATCLLAALGTAAVCTKGIRSCSLALPACLIPANPACEPALASCIFDFLACGIGTAAVELCYYQACRGSAAHEQPAKRARDPNEKVVTSGRFVQPDQRLVYPIHFENVGSIEARDVFVTDPLDPNLDVSTLDIVTPGGTFDSAARTVKWSLLNRNLQPGETGNVILSIRPRPGLPSGATIRNKATIQFEIFESIDTNETVNIIDTTRPNCTMNPLPSQTSSTTIPISWTGADLVGEIDSYTVLVSQDGGAFTRFLDAVQTASGVFQGQPGKTYGFLCVAKDTAGNIEVQSDTAETTTRIVAADTTPPVITPNITGTLGNNGWYRSNVTVTWGTTDPESGIASSNGCTSTSLTNETAGTILTCSATNGAALSSSVPVTIKIDKTPPVATATVVPTPNANGWNNTSVAVSFTGTDTLSGINSCTAPISLSQGAGQTASGTCTDKAGNVSAPATARVNIDKTPPVISGMPAAGCSLWPPNHKLIRVATVSGADALSGLASFKVSGASNEPSDPKDPDILISGTGLQPRVIQLRADRLGTGTGRVYTLTATATDAAGNTNTSVATCVVPHDQSK